MDDLIKVIFFIIAAVFIGSVLNNADISLTGDNTTTPSRGSYLRSYDRDGDGVVSDAEYERGESARIEKELQEVQEAVIEALKEEVRSPYATYFDIRSGNMRAEDQEREYVVLRVAKDLPAPVAISGWKLKSLVTGRGQYIGKGVALLDPVRPWRFEKNIVIAPGEEAIITSGSAVGINTSFALNSCTGYLEERRDFSPSISRQCPRLEDEDLASFDLSYNDFDDEEEYDDCMDAIERVPSCQLGSPDTDVVKECKKIIRTYSTYKGCFELHADDADFIKDEWRIFLGADDELWRNEREAVALFDENNRVVDIIEY